MLFIAFMISLAGYGMFILFRFSVNPSFIPAIIVSSITVLMFFAGLLNILVFTTYSLFIIGIVLFIAGLFMIYKHKLSVARLYSPAIVFFSLLTVVFVLLLHNSIFVYYDNFSHWALIVKEMITKDILPDDSTIITYRNYPPGTALFIYFTVKIVGFSESMSLIAQSLLTASFLTTLFAFSSWKRPMSVIIPLTASLCSVLVLPFALSSLIVDTVLGYLSIATFAVIFYYRNNIFRLSLISAPLLSMIVLTKDSGKIFFGFLVAWIVLLLARRVFIYKNITWKLVMQTLTSAAVIPLFINYLWGQYQKKAYSIDYEENRFAITMDIFNIDRSEEFIQNLLPHLISYAFNFSSAEFMTLILVDVLAIVVLVSSFFFFRKNLASLLYNVIYLNVIYLVYVGFLYILYLFIMPEVEAAYLAGFDRYQASIVIFLIGSMLFVINGHLYQKKNVTTKVNWLQKTIIGCSVLITIPLLPNVGELFQDTEGGVRDQLLTQYQALHSHTDITTADNITIIKAAENDDNGYIRHMMNYERLSENTDQFFTCESKEKKDSIQQSIKESKYMIILNMNDQMKNCLKDVSGGTDLTKGIYTIEDNSIEPVEK